MILFLTWELLLCTCCSKISTFHSEKKPLQKMHESYSNTSVNVPYKESWKEILPSTDNFHCLLTFHSSLEFNVLKSKSDLVQCTSDLTMVRISI